MRTSFNRFWLVLFTAFLFIKCTKETNNFKNPPVAEAGNSQTIQLPVSNATLSGSGTTENFKITGYLWSLVSGPNVPEIESESSATTNVSGLSAGTYVFQLMVVDSAGLSDVDTVSWIVNAAVQQTLTLQPANNPNSGHVDSYFNQGGTGDTEHPIGSWTNQGTPFSWRTLLKFDLSSIPASSTIVSATLYLYAMPNPHGGDMINAHSGTANACFVERVINSWTFNGLTWANQPATTATNRSIIPQSTTAFQNDVIDVKALVQDMVDLGNFGFGIRQQNEVYYNCKQYASSYHSNAALHPKLVITYQP
jgi:hypothetical protein